LTFSLSGKKINADIFYLFHHIGFLYITSMRYCRLKFRFLCFIEVVLLAATMLSAQEVGDPLQSDQNRAQFRLAQTYEQAGEFMKALPIYERLYSIDENNLVISDALSRTYLQLKMYDNAIVIVSQRLARGGNDIITFGVLGDCYYKAGKESDAFAAWNRGIEVFKNSETAYRVISRYLIENRLYDRAIQMLEEGRDRSPEPAALTQEIGLLYASSFRYEDATREYLSIVVNKGLSTMDVIRQRISWYISKPEALRSALMVAKKTVAHHKDNVALHILLAWLYQEAKEYDSAFDVYKTIDALQNAQGREILSFGERVMKERAFQVAAKAFKEYIDRYPAQAAIPQAKFGYARVLEDLATQPDSTDIPSIHTTNRSSWLAEAIQSYNALSREYPLSPYARLALYRIALVKFNVYFDIDGALLALDEIRRRYTDSRTHSDIAIITGDIYVARGDLDQALASYRMFLGGGVDSDQRDINVSLFKCTQIEYYRGDFDSALAHLAPLAQETTSDISNDAIKLQTFIQYHRKNQENALKTYAGAELLSRQHKYTEAIALLNDILKQFPSSLLLDDALIFIGNLSRSAGQYLPALTAYQRLVDEYPESMYSDQAMFDAAELYQTRLSAKEKAVRLYELFLERFPNSLLVGEARKRIRILRGDSL
jgi:tetratricopeptide (TPR) repeat protein